MDSPQVPAALFRRKKEYKRGISYSILLLGRNGTGKTTFANNLLETNIFSHQYESDIVSNNIPSVISDRIKVTKPTKVVSFTSNDGLPDQFNTKFDPSRSQQEPGITITSTSIEIITSAGSSGPGSGSGPNSGSNTPSPSLMDDEDDDIIVLNLINTYGIGDNLDDSICFDEIISFLEQQFDYVLAEETRIRRNPRFEDSRVHVALYFIEPNGHGLSELDVELMKRVSRYTNVLPIISKADSLTREELNNFKKIILEDIQRYNVPVFKFEVDPDEDDYESIEENETLSRLQPFAIICSDTKDNKTGHYYREYPWGSIENVNDSKVSDLLILKNVLFGSHLQEFKDTTQNLLYENYRSEKLSSVTLESHVNSNNPKFNEITNSTKDNIDKRASAVPSLSNFASLINTGTIPSSQSLANKLNENGNPTTPKMKNSFKENGGNYSENDYVTTRDENKERENSNNDQQQSPIKQMSEEIKLENQNIINSIKKDATRGSLSPVINERNKLRNISETVPYVLQHERIIAKQQKLEELEAQSAKELQRRIQELEKKAQELKLREKHLKKRNVASSKRTDNQVRTTSVNSISQLKKNETYSDLASIVSGSNMN